MSTGEVDRGGQSLNPKHQAWEAKSKHPGKGTFSLESHTEPAPRRLTGAGESLLSPFSPCTSSHLSLRPLPWLSLQIALLNASAPRVAQ